MATPKGNSGYKKKEETVMHHFCTLSELSSILCSLQKSLEFVSVSFFAGLF